MSVAMSKSEGVTVLTLTSDPDSACPPLCQIMKGFCYSPVCCSVSRHMRTIQNGSLSALGALQIMIGLLNIGLGVILTCSGGGSWYMMDESAFPYWMGGFFILFGIVCILAEKFPSPCLVFLMVLLHLAGVVFAISAVVLYSINMAHVGFWWMCDEERYWYGRTTPRPISTEDAVLKEKCLEAKELVLALVRSINGVLIVLSVLEVCVAVSAFVLGIKFMISRGNKAKQGAADPEQYRPLLEDAAASQPSA